MAESRPRRPRASALRARLGVRLYRLLPAPDHWKHWLGWCLSPRYSVGVQALIQDEAGRFLLLKPSYVPGWQLPGGTVGYHESLEDAMQREVEEETGLLVRRLEPAGICLDASGRQLHALFLVAVQAAPIRLSGEHLAWRYCDPERLPPLLREVVKVAETNPGVPVVPRLHHWG